MVPNGFKPSLQEEGSVWTVGQLLEQAESQRMPLV
jgi:hypothetical protein